MSDDKVCAVPLREQLASVPTDARLVIDEGIWATRFIPVGRMCNEAAERIEQLERELADAGKRYVDEIAAHQETHERAEAEKQRADANERDAARYRWMKANVQRIPLGWGIVGWDAAIDAATKEGKP